MAWRGRVAVLADAHCDDGNRRALKLACAVLRAAEPDLVIYLGDLVSVAPLSHWPKMLPSSKTYRDSLRAAAKFLDSVATAAPKAKQIYVEGNHDRWPAQWCAEHPEMAGFVSLAENLRLAERGIAYQGGTYPLIREWAMYHHGDAAKSQPARFYADKFSPRFAHRKPVYFGHHHNLERTPSALGSYAQCCGYLGSYRPDYLRAQIPAWEWGLLIQDVDGALVSDHVVRFDGARALWGRSLIR